MVQYSQDLPEIYQNFLTVAGVEDSEVGQLGSSVTLADFCPYIQVGIGFTLCSQYIERDSHLIMTFRSSPGVAGERERRGEVRGVTILTMLPSMIITTPWSHTVGPPGVSDR